MPTLTSVWGNLVDGLMGFMGLTRRGPTPPSPDLQINVSGDHNAINVVLPPPGRDGTGTSSSGTSRAAVRATLNGAAMSSDCLTSGRAQSSRR